MMSEKEKIDLITQISLDINQVKDIDLLLERILTNVRKFLNADAGSIYLRQGEELKFSYSQNDTLQKRLPPGKKLIYNTFSIPIKYQMGKFNHLHAPHTGAGFQGGIYDSEN